MGHLTPMIDDLDQIPRLAHAKYRTYRPDVLVEHDSRAQASCIYAHMVAEADRRFAGRRGIVPKEHNGLKVWLIADKAVVRFKKHDEDGQSRNYPTKQAEDYDRRIVLPWLPPEAARVSIGYWLDPTQTEIIRVQVARPRGPKSVEWCAAIVPATVSSTRWQDVTRQRGLG